MRNLALVVVVSLVIFFWKPDAFVGAVADYGKYFGPMLLLFIVIFALPLRRKAKK
jgi:hypothetical protein